SSRLLPQTNQNKRFELRAPPHEETPPPYLSIITVTSHPLRAPPAGGRRFLEAAVRAHEHEAEGEAAEDGDAEHGGDDAVALAVAVVGQVPDVGPGHVAELAEGVDHGDGDGALGRRARERGRDPRVEDDEAAGGCAMRLGLNDLFGGVCREDRWETYPA
ncbi:bb9c0dee-6315-4aed-9e05-cb89f535090d, partial [Thermothielavioides terrestris]